MLGTFVLEARGTLRVCVDAPLTVCPHGAISGVGGSLSAPEHQQQPARRFSFAFSAPQALRAESVDALLVSSYDALLALPYWTEYSAFAGRIFATEPTVLLGRVHLDEFRNTFADADIYFEDSLFLYHSESPPSAAKPAKGFLYTAKDIAACLDKITVVRLKEKIELGDNVSVFATSSGYFLGSCNWVMETIDEKIFVLGKSSKTKSLHPAPLDLAHMDGCDEIVVSSLLVDDNCATLEQVRNGICQFIGHAVQSNGNVVFPLHSVGYVYDLIDLINQYLTSIGFKSLPIHFLSSVGKSSLHVSSILGEWMNANNESKLYTADWPLPHQRLLATKRVVLHDDLQTLFNFKGPLVVLAASPYFMLGECRSLIDVWRAKGQDSIILLTDPKIDYSNDATRSHFTPLGDMPIKHLPFETGFSYRTFLDMIAFQAGGKSATQRKLRLHVPHAYRGAVMSKVKSEEELEHAIEIKWLRAGPTIRFDDDDDSKQPRFARGTISRKTLDSFKSDAPVTVKGRITLSSSLLEPEYTIRELSLAADVKKSGDVSAEQDGGPSVVVVSRDALVALLQKHDIEVTAVAPAANNPAVDVLSLRADTMVGQLLYDEPRRVLRIVTAANELRVRVKWALKL